MYTMSGVGRCYDSINNYYILLIAGCMITPTNVWKLRVYTTLPTLMVSSNCN
ncbi:hypothetical protein V8E54_000716 [Elaphomyces granulatus]